MEMKREKEILLLFLRTGLARIGLAYLKSQPEGAVKKKMIILVWNHLIAPVHQERISTSGHSVLLIFINMK